MFALILPRRICMSQPINGIPSVKFADPDILKKMGIMPGTKPEPQASKNVTDFSMDSDIENKNITIDTFAPDKIEFEQNKQDDHVAKDTANTDKDTPVNQDSSNIAAMFNNLSEKQKTIVNNMCRDLNIKDLFTSHRFKLSYNIIPGQLQVTFQSMTQQELSDFWNEFTDIKGSSMYIEALLAVKYCSRVIIALNKKPLPDSVEEREAIFNGFDHIFIQVLFDYAKLFELARLKFLHKENLEQNPT